MRFLILAVFLCCVGCVSRYSVSQSDNFYPPKRATIAEFTTPKGWRVRSGSVPHEAAIIPRKKKDDSRYPIGISYYRQYYRAIENQDELSHSYLKAIHSKNDEDVKKEYISEASNEQFGKIPIYLFYSDYWQFRLTAFIAKDDDYIHLEMMAPSKSEALSEVKAFRELIQSIRTR
jgi:hypothetical protein